MFLVLDKESTSVCAACVVVPVFVLFCFPPLQVLFIESSDSDPSLPIFGLANNLDSGECLGLSVGP